jgi:hypothetical protein
MSARRWRKPLACWLGWHDFRPVLEPTRIFAVCAHCARTTEGWTLPRKPLRFVRPIDSEWNRLRMYQHLGLSLERFLVNKGQTPLLRRVK